MLKHMWAALEISAWLLVGETLAVGPWAWCAAAFAVAILLRVMHSTVSESLS